MFADLLEGASSGLAVTVSPFARMKVIFVKVLKAFLFRIPKLSLYSSRLFPARVCVLHRAQHYAAI